ncbi:hypothetical protein AAC387_Pa09g2441 [Persea americana]
MDIKVAALCGSLRKASCNRGLICSAIEICRESIKGMEMEYVDIEPLPLISTDLEMGDSFPEYNYSVSAPLKNAIDWASRPPNVWAGKPAAIASTGGGFGGGRSHDGNLIHSESKEKLEQVLLSLQAFTHRLQGKS